MANVLIFSVLELASGFAPTLTSFFVLRALYGIAMGGEWGVGAALTMESIPAAWRGPVSGLLQAGYPSGFLLATLLNWAAFDALGWRGLFMLGAVPALLVLYVRRNVPESPDWLAGKAERRRTKLLPVAIKYAPLFLYAIVLMTAFNFFSHGTQDLYKSFLTKERHLPLQASSIVLICMNVAAMAGGIACAALSQRIGRRRAIVIATVLTLPVIPLWAFATHAVWIGVGAVLMQLCVQGAWGVIPAHLNELSPSEVRGTFPGLTYQLGNFLASANATLQSGMGDHFFGGDITWPLAIVVGIVAVSIAALTALGPEARHVRMGREAATGSPR
jgi:SHS family lactate transporter-like MFS transporter